MTLKFKSPSQSLTSGLEPRSQKAATFAADMLYGTEYDFVLKQAVRHQQSLEEALEHSNCEKIWKEISVGNDVMAQTVDEEADGPHGKQTALLASLMPGVVTNLHSPEHVSRRETAEAAAEHARRQVSSQLRCVDGSQSLERLAAQLREIDFCKLRGTPESSIFILYQVESAGEHERDARRSSTPLRKDHLEKVVKAFLSTRGELPDWEANTIIFPALDPSDLQLYSV